MQQDDFPDDAVYSDPLAELPVKNRKCVRGCTEIYLANKHISKLANFEDFVNLNIVWLNHNRIRRIINLDFNIRIKKLYLQVRLPRTRFACFHFCVLLWNVQ